MFQLVSAPCLTLGRDPQVWTIEQVKPSLLSVILPTLHHFVHGLSLKIDLLSRFLDPNGDGYLEKHTLSRQVSRWIHPSSMRSSEEVGTPEEKYQ